jgi:hypothetical protein
MFRAASRGLRRREATFWINAEGGGDCIPRFAVGTGSDIAGAIA